MPSARASRPTSTAWSRRSATTARCTISPTACSRKPAQARARMPALRIYAGPAARRHIEKQGLQAADVGVVPAAAGGPKGLVLGPLDRFLFGDWLPRTNHPVHLVGASIGAWRMATACLREPIAAFER